jgi:hypothetical protein
MFNLTFSERGECIIKIIIAKKFHVAGSLKLLKSLSWTINSPPFNEPENELPFPH